MHLCIYCGEKDMPLHRDHITPISICSVSRHYSGNDTVSCCKECNKSLSNAYITTLEERACHLIDLYTIKHRKLLQTADYDPEELEEMGPIMTRTIKASMNEKRIVKDRLAFLAKTASGLYKLDRKLSGIATMEKAVIYKMIDDFVDSGKEKLQAFYDRWAERLGCDSGKVQRIIEEREMFDVSLTYKYNHQTPLDAGQWRTNTMSKTKEQLRAMPVVTVEQVVRFRGEVFAHISEQNVLIGELAEALEAALEWIDSVPDGTELPAMPGFCRDWADSTLAKTKEKQHERS